MLTSGRTKSVQDAPTTNDHCCTEAKPSECPKGDRDNKSEVNFKNRLFLQTDCCNRQLQQSVNHIILYFAFKVNTRSALSSIRLILISPLFTAFSTALKDFSRLSGMRIISAPAFTAITAAISDV